MITVDGLSFRYIGRRQPALRGVSFALRRGESLLVLGPSGCGKSTLALCLNGVIPHAVAGDFRGRVRIGDVDTRGAPAGMLARRVGIVFQDPEAQLCTLTVEDEVAFGLENLAVPRPDMDARIDEALAAVGLTEHRRTPIERLSGGQKQRLALATVLALRPEVLVLDEPTAQLDPAGAAEVIEQLRRLRARGTHTLVIVEHRLDGVMDLVDRVLVLGADGAVVAQGHPRQVLRAHGAWLAEAGVWVPQVAEVALLLERRGLALAPFPLTIAEAVEALRPLAPRPATAPSPEVAAGRVSGSPPPGGQPIIDVRELRHRYAPGAPASLDGVTLSLSTGEFVAVAGANGAGKSTLARHLAAILRPPRGAVRLYGRDVAALAPATVARHVGYVFQYPEHQFVGATVLDDVAYGPRRAGMPEAEALRRAAALLTQFDLAHLAPAHPFSLSHGEQRRLSVAAMLILGQEVLVLDEPTYGQDRRQAGRLLDALEGLSTGGKAIVAVTHDMGLVAERARRVVVMADGGLCFDGPPARLFADGAVLERARLAPPPLWEVGRRLGLATPPVRPEDLAAWCLRGAAGSATGSGA